MDGENVSIFAYGATGSGKTYTMQGPVFDTISLLNETSGILPRTADFIFNEMIRLNKMNITFKLSISALEIYNDNIYDLLDKNRDKSPLAITLIKNNVTIKNLTWNTIKTREDIIKYIREATNSRKSDYTQFNDNSSRSHAVYQIRIDTINKIGQEIQSNINIIDLAGSEKCTLNFNNKSKEEIELMKKLQNEANYINKSLTTLGRIIAILTDKKSSKISIPYRESKLTMILQVIYELN
jgi:hypothetical protein